MIELYGIISVVIIMVFFLHYAKSMKNGTPATISGPQSQWAKFWKNQKAAAEAADGQAMDDVAVEVVRAEEIIMARSQRRAFGLKDDDDDESSDNDAQTVHELMTSWCAKFDGHEANALQLDIIVNEFCNYVEDRVEKNRANLADFYKLLALITEVSHSVKEQMNKIVVEEIDEDDENCELPQFEKSSDRCLAAVAKAEDEEVLLSVYEQFVDYLQRKFPEEDQLN